MSQLSTSRKVIYIKCVCIYDIYIKHVYIKVIYVYIHTHTYTITYIHKAHKWLEYTVYFSCRNNCRINYNYKFNIKVNITILRGQGK